MLEDAGLLVPVWRGREKHHYLNPAPLQALPTRWVTTSPVEDTAAFNALREALPAMTDGSDRGSAVRRPGRSSLAADPIAALLLRPPSPKLQGQPVVQMDALAAAIDYLAETAQAIQAVLRAAAPDQGYAKPADGGFSLAEHIWHLADIESLGWRPRFTRILCEERPRLPGVDGDRLAVESRYQSRPWRGAARRFLAQRRRSLAVLKQFNAEVLRLPVTFSGARTRAAGVVAAAVAHDLDHRPAMAERWLELSADVRKAAVRKTLERPRGGDAAAPGAGISEVTR